MISYIFLDSIHPLVGITNLLFQILDFGFYFAIAFFCPIFATLITDTKVIDPLFFNAFCCPINKTGGFGDISINTRDVRKATNSPRGNANLYAKKTSL